MGIDLEFRGHTTGTWPLTTSCLGHVEHLRKCGLHRSIDVIFGSEDLQAGSSRSVERILLLEAIADMIPMVSKLPSGFEVHILPIYGGSRPIVSRGAGGAMIDGEYYIVNCWEDYWTIQTVEESRAGREPLRRYEAARIQTDNLGIIEIQSKPARRSDFAKLLRELRKFIQRDSSDTIQIVWG